MGIHRQTSFAVGAARARSAEKTKCPQCGRKSAIILDGQRQTDGEGNLVLVTVKLCRWVARNLCTYQVTTTTKLNI